MSHIRSGGNKDTELALIKLLRRHRIVGWRRNQSVLGKPDFVFRQARLALFVDGCFWHGRLKHSKPPRSNPAYWRGRKNTAKTRERNAVRGLAEKRGARRRHLVGMVV